MRGDGQDVDTGGPRVGPTMNTTAWRRNAAPLRVACEGVLRLSRPPVRDAFGTMLQRWPWEVFVTWTFRERSGPIKVEREIRQWLRFVEWQRGRPFGWMFGLEQEGGADRPHGHGLLIGVAGLRWTTLWAAWFTRNGACRTEAVASGAAVSFYCSKYVAKRGAVFFSDNLHTYASGYEGERDPAQLVDVGQQLALGAGADDRL